MANQCLLARRGFAAFALSAISLFAIGSVPAAERRASFNDHWLFLKGDAADAANSAFDDSSWRKLDLPHDWAIEGPFDSKYSPNTGGLPIFGVAWYRKHFTIPASGRGQFYSVEFDGAMSNSQVFLNGHELGGRPYGYSSFELDLTPFLNFGQDNVIAVRLDPETDSSRWYPGAGIYRNVWLVSTGPVHVAHWGTYLTTPNVSDSSATVLLRSEIRNRKSEPAQVTVETTIRDANGSQVSVQRDNLNVAGGQSQSASQSIKVANPQRWDIDQPYLYQAVTVVRSGNQILDRYTTPFGIRTIEFNRDKGFLLNGRKVKIHGVCNHHDLGALGTAVNRRATERQLQIMKSMGVNAIRTSHNPPSPELLEYCDRMGLMVMDESFDMWRVAKVKNGYSKYFEKWAETDMRDLLRRDRNHPSVIMWSIGNEIPEQNKPEGAQTAKFLTGIAHQEDPTRPTTSAFDNWSNAIKNGLADEVDVPGFNYKPEYYEQILKEHPKWAIYGSETASCISSRGVYHLPLKNFERDPSLQVSSYDVVAPPWANYTRTS